MCPQAGDTFHNRLALKHTPGPNLDDVLERQKTIIEIQDRYFSVAPSPAHIFSHCVIYLDLYDPIRVWHEGANPNDAYSIVLPETPAPKNKNMSLIEYQLASHGAVLVDCITLQTTHVISTETQSDKLKHVLDGLNRLVSDRFYVVHAEWVKECIKSSGIVDENTYSLG